MSTEQDSIIIQAKGLSLQSGMKSMYYSQRYESLEEDASLDVCTFLQKIQKKSGCSADKKQVPEMMEQMGITAISERKLM